jgi:hypothetical protein
MRKGRLCIRKICTKIKMMNNFWMLIFDAAYFFFMHFSFLVTVTRSCLIPPNGERATSNEERVNLLVPMI